MKKLMVVLAALSIVGVALAEEINSILAEFNRREAIVLTQDQARAITYLKGIKFKMSTILRLDVLANPDQFTIKLRNGDDCHGDLQAETLNCTFNQAHAAALTFLTEEAFDTTKIAQLEMLNDQGRFVMQVLNGDVCLGDISIRLLRCKNAMGMTTIYFSGDAD